MNGHCEIFRVTLKVNSIKSRFKNTGAYKKKSVYTTSYYSDILFSKYQRDIVDNVLKKLRYLASSVPTTFKF